MSVLLLSLLASARAACPAPDLARLVDELDLGVRRGATPATVTTAASAIARLECLDRAVTATELAVLYQLGAKAARDAERPELMAAWCRSAVTMGLVDHFDPKYGSGVAADCAEAGRGMDRLRKHPWQVRYPGTIDGEPVTEGQTVLVLDGVHLLQESDGAVRTRWLSLWDPASLAPASRPPLARYALTGGGAALVAGGAVLLAGSAGAFLDVGRAEGADGGATRGDTTYEASVARANLLRVSGFVVSGAGLGLLGAGLLAPGPTVQIGWVGVW